MKIGRVFNSHVFSYWHNCLWIKDLLAKLYMIPIIMCDCWKQPKWLKSGQTALCENLWQKLSLFERSALCFTPPPRLTLIFIPDCCFTCSSHFSLSFLADSLLFPPKCLIIVITALSVHINFRFAFNTSGKPMG